MVGIHSDGKVKVQRFVWVSEPVKVMETARCQLVELTVCHLVAPGTEHQGCVCPGCSLSWPKLVWAKGSRTRGHLTAQVQVQGLKDSSQQLVSAGPGRFAVGRCRGGVRNHFKMIQKTSMFAAGRFTTAERWQQPKCPLVDDG